MNILKKISQIDKKYALTFFIGLAFGGISIYVGFFYQIKPNIKYEILSNSNVLDVYAELSKLDILYDGISIKKDRKNLRVIKIKIINNGKKGVLQSHYAKNDLLGLTIKDGNIIEKPELLNTSSLYLKQSLEFFMNDSNQTVRFSNIIFDADEFFLLKLLVLHDEDKVPKVLPVGKVAGLKQPEVVEVDEAKSERPLLLRIIYGFLKGIGIIFAFIFGLGLILSIILGPLEIIKHFREKRKRKKLLSAYKYSISKDITKFDKKVFDIYLKKGLERLKKIRKFLSDSNNIKRLFPIIYTTSKIERSFFHKLTAIGSGSESQIKMIPDLSDIKFLEYLSNGEFIEINKDNYKINDDLLLSLNDLLEFLIGRDV